MYTSVIFSAAESYINMCFNTKFEIIYDRISSKLLVFLGLYKFQ